MQRRWDCSESASVDGSLSHRRVVRMPILPEPLSVFLSDYDLFLYRKHIRMSEKNAWEGEGEGLAMCEPSEYIKEKGWLD